jgi:hypothetical protein
VGSKHKRATAAVAWGERGLGGARVAGTERQYTHAEPYSHALPQEVSPDARTHVLHLVGGMKRTMVGLQDELRALPEPDAETRLTLVRERLAQAERALEDLTKLSRDPGPIWPKPDGDARGPRRPAPHSGVISIAIDD